MAELTISVKKEEVYEEVAKTTTYTGVKLDPASYERMFTTDKDKAMLDRFWDECKNTVCNSLKKVLSDEEEADSVYKLTLDLSSSFDQTQLESMQRSLFSYFVTSITAKWFVFTNKEEVSDYTAGATSYLEDVMRKVFFKKKPTRPTYN